MKVLVALGLASLCPSAADAQTLLGTAFTYQGRLTDAGVPPTGPYDLRFILYNAAVGGSQVGPTVTRDDVAVAAGLFTTPLDFGGAVFTGSARWLEVAARPGASSGAYTVLSPRQELTPSPNAVFGGTAPWTGVLGKPAGFADDVDNDSGGDVTAVLPGPGLTGGGMSGDLTMGVSFGGSGVSTTAARIDHDHFAHTWIGSSVNGLVVDSSAIGANGLFARASALTGAGWGVYARTDSSSSTARGVYGLAANGGTGVYGESASVVGRGVQGVATADAGTFTTPIGVAGIAAGGGATVGVYGEASSASGFAGFFAGDIEVVGVLSKGGGSFKIDHPLDPENKFLYHSFVESPDMKNVYDGVVVLDADGEADIELPAWFEALNRDFRYQLTCIGAFAPVYVSAEIANNRFRIAGGAKHLKVSWQVTGIRHDPFAEAHRIPVEQDKDKRERGRYLYPRVHGAPDESAIGELLRRPLAAARAGGKE